MATVELEIFGALCATKAFKINGVEASSDDFGNQEDEDRENAEDYGCVNMQFTRKPPEEGVLRRYGITVGEYEDIAEQLEEKLSFGCCGWCV